MIPPAPIISASPPVEPRVVNELGRLRVLLQVQAERVQERHDHVCFAFGSLRPGHGLQ